MQAVTLAVAEARAINEENRNATVIFISGATGRFATLVNGPYAPSQLNGLDGRRLYRKIGDDTICIQHRSHADHSLWRVQRAEQKDTDSCVAFIDGGCALHSCTSRVWHVHNGAEFQEQPNVEMVTAVNAEQKVSSYVLIELLQFTNHATVAPANFLKSQLFFRSLILNVLLSFIPLPPHNQQYACNQGFSCAQAAAEFARDAGEQRAIAIDNSNAVDHIKIIGATGASGVHINGLYSLTQERGLDGRVVYIKKIGDFCMRIQHSSGAWQVQNVSSTGSFACWAFISSGGFALQECGGSRSWRQFDIETRSFIDQPGIHAMVATEICHSETPNCCLKEVTGPDGVEFFVVAKRTIQAGENFTINHRSYPNYNPGHPCILLNCGSRGAE